MNLQPSDVFKCFAQVNQIPRPSKKEEQMIDFLLDFGKKLNLETRRDDAGNVIICKPATPGMEDRQTIVLQSHMDMVCEKNKDVDFDFTKDAIQTYVDGEWMKAKGTTLGADDGIGVAMEMALLESTDIKHGPLECVFTRDEETGLTVENPKLCGTKQFQTGNGERYVVFFYKTNCYSGQLKSSDEGEVFWIPRGDLHKYTLCDDFPDIVRVFEEDSLSGRFLAGVPESYHRLLLGKCTQVDYKAVRRAVMVSCK